MIEITFQADPLQSFSLFLPSINKELGYSSIKAQLFSVPPNIMAFVTVLITADLSDRLKVRGPFMLVGLCSAIIGYIMLLAGNSSWVKWGGTFFVAQSTYMLQKEVIVTVADMAVVFVASPAGSYPLHP